MKKLLIPFLIVTTLVFGAVCNVEALTNNWGATVLTGGGTGALDEIDGELLTDLDAAFVNILGLSYIYTLDADASGAESSPTIINPDTNPGTKSWLLQGLGCNNITLSGLASILSNTGTIQLGEADNNLNVTGTLTLEDTTTSTTGVVYKGEDRFIHNFHHPTGGGAVPDGFNICIGVDAGNFTMGSTATSTTQGSYNNFIGYQSGYNDTTGSRDNFIGVQSGYTNTTGYSNNFMGYQSGYSNTSGYRNDFMGRLAGLYNTVGKYNIYIGHTSGRYYGGTTGENTTSDYCTLIGGDTDVSADGAQRETVIGYNAIGKGDDTVILGAEGANTKVYATGGLVVNDEGSDVDTQIKGSIDDNLVYVDAGNETVGVGTVGATKFHVDSNAADTTAIVTVENTGGDFQVFRDDASPEGVITGSIGDLCIDGTGGDIYIKNTGTATNTGWAILSSGGAPDQNLWETITSDTGSAVANITTDTLTIAGGTNCDTSVTGDVLTIDVTAGGAPEGTAVLSTGEGGGTKFLGEDGDGTSSWKTVVAGHDGTIQWTGTSILETGIAFQFGDASDATITHTYANNGTDVDIAYSTGAMAITGALTATNLSGSNTGDNTVATSGDAALDFFGGGVTAVTDATTCTDIEGTLLSIAGGTLNAAVNTADIGDVSVTQTEFSQLQTLAATTISVNQWIALGGIAETLTFGELNILDGALLDVTELNYVNGVTSDIQTQFGTKQATVTDGNALTFTGATLNFDGGDSPSGDLGGTWGIPSVNDDSHNHVITNIDSFTKTELETQTSDVVDFAEADGDAYTGTHDFGGATQVEIVNSGTYSPGVVAGQIGLDTTITSHNGMLRYYDGAVEMVIPAIPAADLTTTDGHVIDYNAAGNKFTMDAPAAGGETNSLEVVCTGIETTEIPIGTAADTVAYNALSGEATMDNGGVVTLRDASLTQDGAVELSTAAEINIGNDTTRAMGVDEFQASNRNISYAVFSLIESTTDVAVDTDIGGDFRVPFDGVILQSDTNTMQFAASNSTAGITGTMVIDVHLNGTTICTTNKLDIETTEKTTEDATTQPDLTTTAISEGDILTFHIDAIHSGTAAKGLKVYMAIRRN